MVIFLKLNKKFYYLGGLVIGTVNGLFGAGGGMIAVPLLQKMGIDGHKAHSSAVAIILPITFFSFLFYLYEGRVAFSEGLPFIIPGILGAAIGPFLLTKIKTRLLRRIFGALIIYAGLRMIL